MKKEAHISSSSGAFERSSVQYKKESEVSTYKAHHRSVSSCEPYPATTMKVTHTEKGNEKYSAKFSVNIPKINREEANYRINQRLSGKRVESISTKNE